MNCFGLNRKPYFIHRGFIMRKISVILLAAPAMLSLLWPAAGFSVQDGKRKVVASFADYAAIAGEIGGDRVVTDFISFGDMDPHYVQPKPSLVKKLLDADLRLTTGLDRELWSTTLLDKARNSRIMDGQKGFVAVSSGVGLVEKPT